MSSLRILTALALLSPVASYATSYTWTNVASSTWDTNANWSPNTGYPGSTGTTDTATFNSPGVTVTQSSTIPTINGITYTLASGNYTIQGVGLEFVGTNPFLTSNAGLQLISAPITLGLASPQVLTTTVSAGSLTLTGPLSDFTGTSSFTLASGAGTFINKNSFAVGVNINLTSGSIVQNAVTMSAGGTFTISGATVTSNNSMTAPFICDTVTSGPLLTGAAFNITSGNITLDSSATCSPITADVVFGTTLQATTTTLNISGGTITASNEAVISSPGPQGSVGAQVAGNGVTISGGTLNFTNSGAISTANVTQNAGTVLYNSSNASNNFPLTISGGTVTCINTGLVTTGVGVKVVSGLQGVSTAPINISAGSLSMTNQAPLTGGVSDPANGAFIIGSTLTVSGTGSLTLTNSALLNASPGQAVQGSFTNIALTGGTTLFSNTGNLTSTGNTQGTLVTVNYSGGSTGAFSFSGGTFTNSNTGSIASGNGTQTLIEGNSVSLTGGTSFIVTNSGAVTGGGSVGSAFGTTVAEGGTGVLTLGGTPVTLINTAGGAVSSSTTGARGARINAGSVATSGSGSTVTQSNAAAISNLSTNIGSYFFTSGAMNLSVGTWTATNTGAVTDGMGVGIQAMGNINLSGTQFIEVLNASSAGVSAANSFGGQFVTQGTLNFTGGTPTLTLENDQNLTGTGGVGVQALSSLGSSMSAGTLNINNTATVGGTATSGVEFGITIGGFTQTGGAVSLNNTGTVTSTVNLANGVAFTSNDGSAVNLSGGTFTEINNAAVTTSPGGAIGAFFNASGAVTISGTSNVTVTNTALGTITAPANTFGSQFSGSGLTISGGTVTLSNAGTLSGTNDIGVYYYNSSTGPMTFSGGTFTATNTSNSVGSSYGIKIISGPAGVSTAPITVSGGSATVLNTGNLTSGQGTYIQGSTLTVSSGSLSLSNSGTLTSSPGQGTEGVFKNISITGGTTLFSNTGALTGAGNTQGTLVTVNYSGGSTGAFSFSGGTFTNSNSAPISSGNGTQTVVLGNSVSLTGGTAFIVTNSGVVTGGGSRGSLFGTSNIAGGTGVLTLGGTPVTLSNTVGGSVSSSTTGAIGAELNVGSVATSGSGSTVTQTNAAAISNLSNNIGTLFLSAGNMNLSAGTWSATNTGAVTAGIGLEIQGQGSINLSGTQALTLTNAISAGVSGTSALGCELLCLGTVNFTGGTPTLTLENDQNLAGAGRGVQALIALGSSMTSGTLNINNTNTVGGTATAGAQYGITTGGFTQTGGAVSISNTGTITSTLNLAFGAAFTSGDGSAVNLSGGTFTEINNAAVNTSPGGAIAANFYASGPVTISGTSNVTVTNTALGTVTAPANTFGCQFAGGGLTLSGGTVTLSNAGTLSGTNDIGVYYYNSSMTAPMTFSGGTFTATNTANVGSSFGVKIISGTEGVTTAPITVSGGSVSLLNSANQMTLQGLGAYMQGSALTVSSGSLSIQNTGTLTSWVSQGAAGIFTSIAMSGGTMALLNGNAVTPNLSGTVTGAGALQGTRVLATTTYTQSGGTYSNTNTGTNSSGTGVGSLTNIEGTVSLLGGALSSVNSGNVTVGNGGTFGNATGSYFLSGGAMTLGGGTLTLSNSGNISAPSSSAIGSLMSVASLSTSGSGSALSITNSGAVSAFSGNIGTSFVSLGDITLGAGTWAPTNTGAITNGIGVQINGQMMVNLSGGSINLLNDVTGAVSGSGIGSQLLVGTTLNISNASSTLSLQNNQALVSGTGVQGIATLGASMSAGTFNVTNTADLSHGAATGAAMVVSGGAFNQTGGIFTVSTSGLNSSSGTASYIQAPAITISGTGTFNNPNALVAATTVTLTTGGILQSGTPTVPGVFEDVAFGSTTIVTNNGGTFVSGTLDPLPGQTVINGTFTQTSGTYTVVVGNLNLPSNQGISFLTVNGASPNGVVNLDGGILNVIPATGFNYATDIPAGLEMVQFIQASTIINGGFTPAKITNSVPGLIGMTYETLAGNQGWLFFNFSPPPPPPPPTPVTPPPGTIPYQPITTTTINFINTFLARQLMGMNIGGDQASCVGEEVNCDRYSEDHKKCKPPRKNTGYYKAQLDGQSKSQKSRKASKPLIAAADPLLGFINYQTETTQQQLSERVGRDIKPWDVYFGPIGDLGSINNKHSQLGANYWFVGGLAGFDYSFSQVGLGILVDYENVTGKLHKHGGDFNINQFHATAYMTYVPKSLPQFALNGMVGSGGAWYNIHRHISELKESTHAKSRGAEVDALIGAQYIFAHRQFAKIPCGLEIVPMVNLQYIYQGMGSYNEHGADVNDFRFHKQGYQSLRTTLGTWLQYTWSWNNFSFTPLVDIGWQREFLDQNHKVRVKPIHFAGPGDSISIFGAGRDTLLVGLDLLFEFYNTYGIEASYDFEYNRLYRNNGFYIGFNVRF